MEWYIGIDPGQTGAITALGSDGTIKVHRLDKSTLPEACDFLFQFAACPGVDDAWTARVLLEQVNAMPKQGVASSFKFGASYGRLEGLTVASYIPYKLVRPAKWQKLMRCMSKGDKRVTRAAAQRLFPKTKYPGSVTHITADSMLLAECCRVHWDAL